VGILDGFRITANYQRAIDEVDERVTAGLFDDPSGYPIASPWSDPGGLAKVIASDVFGLDEPPISTRAAAMRIPAIARARNLIVSSIARIPLEVADGPTGEALTDQPTWVYRTDDGTSPQHRLAWTVDDLMFHGWSLWDKRQRDARNFPLTFPRVNHDRWRIDPDTNRVLIDEQPITDPRDVCLISGFHEGILSFGRDTLTDARNLYDIVRERLESPMPSIDLHQTGGADMSNGEVDALVSRWAAARARRRGGVAFTNKWIEAKAIDSGDAQLMIEARNAASLDLARMVGVTAGLIDATAPKASLNYETTTGRNAEFVDRDLALYMTPIAARLSLDDIVPRGQVVRFNMTDFTAPTLSPTGPDLED
jgi:hypothetical protein